MSEEKSDKFEDFTVICFLITSLLAVHGDEIFGSIFDLPNAWGFSLGETWWWKYQAVIWLLCSFPLLSFHLIKKNKKKASREISSKRTFDLFSFSYQVLIYDSSLIKELTNDEKKAKEENKNLFNKRYLSKLIDDKKILSINYPDTGCPSQDIEATIGVNVVENNSKNEKFEINVKPSFENFILECPSGTLNCLGRENFPGESGVDKISIPSGTYIGEIYNQSAWKSENVKDYINKNTSKLGRVTQNILGIGAFILVLSPLFFLLYVVVLNKFIFLNLVYFALLLLSILVFIFSSLLLGKFLPILDEVGKASGDFEYNNPDIIVNLKPIKKEEEVEFKRAEVTLTLH